VAGIIARACENRECIQLKFNIGIAMTQHMLHQDTEEDQRTLRRLGTVIGGFIIATAIMAVTVGVIMG